MSIEIFVNVAPRETRAALLENGALQEVYLERVSRRGLVGNLYKGRVSRVLPGMQAAFIEIGLARTAFLHAADIAFERPEETVVNLPQVDDIRRLVVEGDDILVQVIKIPSAPRARALRPLSPCLRNTSSTCRTARASAYRAASRRRANGCA
jgi:ribonuclease G